MRARSARPWTGVVALGLAIALAGAAYAQRVAPEDPRDVRIRELSDRLSDLERALQGLNAQLEATTRAADLARGDLTRLTDRVSGLEAGRPGGAVPAPPQSSPGAAPPAAAGAPPAVPPSGPPSGAAPATAPGPAPAPAPAAQANPTPAPAQTAGSPPAAVEDGLTAGRRQLQGGDPVTAEATLTAWLAANGTDPKVGEATYLRGRARALRSAWADAASDYIAALRGWPQTWWAPDAVVELARSLGRLGKPAEACQALAELGARYPAATEGARRRAAALAVQTGCGA